MKSYRDRSLRQRCQLAKLGPDGNPLRDANGNLVLSHNGQWFLRVSGGRHSRVRLVPEDYQAYFAQKARQVEEALKAKGVTNAWVSPEKVYEEYTRTFTRPADTYAPPNHPEEFSVVVTYKVCVNWSGAMGSGQSLEDFCDIDPEQTSIFARLASQEPTNGTTRSSSPKSAGKRRGGDDRDGSAEDVIAKALS